MPPNKWGQLSLTLINVGNPLLHVVDGDATLYQPERPVDRVIMSYALSMIPQWRQAIDNAIGMLRPDDAVTVVDFDASHATPRAGEARHGVLARWFGHDGVRLSPEPLEYLHRHFRTVRLAEHLSAVPYSPLAKVPFYVFPGTKT